MTCWLQYTPKLHANPPAMQMQTPLFIEEVSFVVAWFAESMVAKEHVLISRIIVHTLSIGGVDSAPLNLVSYWGEWLRGLCTLPGHYPLCHNTATHYPSRSSANYIPYHMTQWFLYGSSPTCEVNCKPLKCQFWPSVLTSLFLHAQGTGAYVHVPQTPTPIPPNMSLWSHCWIKSWRSTSAA